MTHLIASWSFSFLQTCKVTEETLCVHQMAQNWFCCHQKTSQFLLLADCGHDHCQSSCCICVNMLTAACCHWQWTSFSLHFSCFSIICHFSKHQHHTASQTIHCLEREIVLTFPRALLKTVHAIEHLTIVHDHCNINLCLKMHLSHCHVNSFLDFWPLLAMDVSFHLQHPKGSLCACWCNCLMSQHQMSQIDWTFHLQMTKHDKLTQSTFGLTVF